MNEIINKAITKGAVLFASISGGKDSQAMTKTVSNSFPFIFCEWVYSVWE